MKNSLTKQSTSPTKKQQAWTPLTLRHLPQRYVSVRKWRYK